MKKILSVGFIFFLLAMCPAFVSAAVLAGPTNNLGLLGYWSFNENTGIQAGDSSGNGYTGVMHGNVTWTTGVRGSALQFGGGDDSVNIPGFNRTLTGGGTLVAWVYATAPLESCDAVVFSRGSISNTGINAGSCGDSTKIGYHWNENGPGGGGFFTPGSAPVIPLNQWVLLVVVGQPTQATLYVYSASGKNMYVDGQTLGSPLLDALKIGEDDSSRGFTGKIDEVRIYGRALSTGEVEKLYNTGSVRSGVSSGTLTGGGTNLTSGLVGHWTFDGIDTVRNVSDRSGSGNIGYIFGAPTSTMKRAGKLGQAFGFGQTISDYVQVSNASSLNITSGVAISAWVNANSWNGHGRILQKGLTDNQYQLNDEDPMMFLLGNIDSLQVPTMPSTGEWHHWVGTYDGSTMAIYIDGVLVASKPASGPINTTTDPLFLGAKNDSSPLGDHLDGSLDDVRLYNRGLSAAEVKQLYNLGGQKLNSSVTTLQNGSSLTSGLVGHWTFDNLDVTDRVYDRSGQGNNGAFIGGATTSAKVAGKLGQALRFDGNTTYVNAGTSTSLNITGAITLSAWIKASDFSACVSGCDIISNYNAAGNTAQYEFYLYNNDIGYGSAPGGGAGAGTSNAPVTQTNRWYHIVVTRDNTGVRTADNVNFYVDGVLQPSSAETGTPPSTGFGRTAIGRDGDVTDSTFYFPGVIDDARIYNRVLTPSEVKQLYNLGR